VPAITVEAIVLQAFAYGETSRILRLLTASHGLTSAIARGARRPRSQYSGLLEPFSRGMATLHIRENRELQTLSGFDLSRSGQALGRDLIRFGGASMLAEIVLRATREEDPVAAWQTAGDDQPQTRLFNLIAASFDRLESAAESELEAVAIGHAWQLAACLGFTPQLDACIQCGRPATGAEVRFDYAAGGIRCDDCAPGAPGRTVPARALEALRAMVAGRDVRLGETGGHWWLLMRYLDHHLLEGATLRSLTFIAGARSDDSCDS